MAVARAVAEVPAASMTEDTLAAAVRSAFALGWHVAELNYREDRHPAVSRDRLRQISAIDARTRRQLLMAQISADLDTLGLERRGPVTPVRMAPGVEARKADVPGEPDMPEIELKHGSPSEVRHLHTAILLRLTVKDFEIGKAYSLGVNLGQLVLEAYATVWPDGPDDADAKAALPGLGEVFALERVMEIWSSIKDLKSRFPPYSADPVAATLHDWFTWSGGAYGVQATETRGTIADRLHRQGQLWRALLSGERSPKDCLLFPNYVDAASDMVRRYGGLAVRVLATGWGTLLLGILAAAVAVLILIAAQRLLNNLVASLAGLVAAFGVSWAGIAAVVKRAIGPAEDALWEAEMMAAIAVAINYVPEVPADSAAFKLRGDDPRPNWPSAEDRDPRPARGLSGLFRRLTTRDTRFTSEWVALMCVPSPPDPPQEIRTPRGGDPGEKEGQGGRDD